MSTKITGTLAVIYKDLSTILQRFTPQALALSRFEHSMPLLHLGAAEMLANPQLALEALGPKGARALGGAVIALGERHVSVGQRMIELAAEAEAGGQSGDPKACFPTYTTEVET
jgi:hypothetical protein